MKKLIAALAVAGIGLSASISVQAQGVNNTAPSAQQANTAVKAKLAELGINVAHVQPTPVSGLQEVVTDKGIFYASSDGRYLVQGTMIDLVERENLTENALAQVRVQGIEAYKDSMIVYKADDEKAKITVFTDISCGYCRKLHRELEDYLDAGITVQYLAFPRGGLSGQGYTDLMNVWCASNPQEALTEAKSGEATKKVANCSAPVAEHYQLGQSFGISGTPAIIMSDGSMIPGYQPAAAISAMIDQKNKG